MEPVSVNMMLLGIILILFGGITTAISSGFFETVGFFLALIGLMLGGFGFFQKR